LEEKESEILEVSNGEPMDSEGVHVVLAAIDNNKGNLGRFHLAGEEAGGFSLLPEGWVLLRVYKCS
jgi:hypothetical protein